MSATQLVSAQISGFYDKAGVTYYQILVCEGGQQWTVDRRYTDFAALHHGLQRATRLPHLPPKSFWRKTFLQSFRDDRQHGLNQLLQVILASPAARDPSVAGFLGLQASAPAYMGPVDARALKQDHVPAAPQQVASAPPPTYQQPAVYAQPTPAVAGQPALSAQQPARPAHAQPACPHAQPAYMQPAACAHTPAYGQPVTPVQPMAPVQPVYAQPVFAQPAYAQPAYAQPAYAHPTVFAQPASYPHHHGLHHHQGPHISAGAAAVGAGALGVVGGMLLEEAIESRWREPAHIAGPGFFGGPGLFGSEQVIQDVRTDMWGDTEVRTEVIDRDMFGNIEDVREQVVDRDMFGDVTSIREEVVW